MPIKVQCQCGQVLSVPDQLAGKSGKCPKCQTVLKIPSATPSTSAPQAAPPQAAPPQAAPPQARPQAPARPAAPAAISPKGGLDDLLQEAGVLEEKGPTCPRCQTPIRPGQLLCVKCGMNFQTGEQMAGHQIDKAESFGNLYLDEAASMMQRDAVMERRTASGGLPWWVLLIILFMTLSAGTLGILIVEFALTGEKSENEVIARIQGLPVAQILGLLVSLAGSLISVISQILILVHGFRNSVYQGLAILFIPCYALIYLFQHYDELAPALYGIILAMLLSFVGGGLMSMGAS